MVTLKKYLYAPWQASAPGEGSNHQAWVSLVLEMMGAVEQQVLNAPSDRDLREALKAVRGTFEQGSEEDELFRAADDFSTLLKRYRERVTHAARAQSNDIYRILAMVNEALLLLAAGSTRTVGRLKQLEHSLERATSLNDIAALKSKLSEILTAVRDDVRREREESRQERETMDQQMQHLRQEARCLTSDLPGREEATAMVEQILQSADPQGGSEFCFVVFVLGRLREIVRRYGDSAANDLVRELVHRRLKFPDLDVSAFRWSPEAVLIGLRWTEGLERLNAFIEPLAPSQFEHRLFLGARAAVLRIGIHWVALPAMGGAAELIYQIDGFARGKA
jgi:hypothetical protein